MYIAKILINTEGEISPSCVGYEEEMASKSISEFYRTWDCDLRFHCNSVHWILKENLHPPVCALKERQLEDPLKDSVELDLLCLHLVNNWPQTEVCNIISI